MLYPGWCREMDVVYTNEGSCRGHVLAILVLDTFASLLFCGFFEGSLLGWRCWAAGKGVLWHGLEHQVPADRVITGVGQAMH